MGLKDRSILHSALPPQRKSPLMLGPVQDVARNIFADGRSMLESVSRTAANQPNIRHFRMPVDQKIPAGSVLILANSRLHNRRSFQGRESIADVVLNPLDLLLRHNP